jgi:hypothetical protein
VEYRAREGGNVIRNVSKRRPRPKHRTISMRWKSSSGSCRSAAPRRLLQRRGWGPRPGRIAIGGGQGKIERSPRALVLAPRCSPRKYWASRIFWQAGILPGDREVRGSVPPLPVASPIRDWRNWRTGGKHRTLKQTDPPVDRQLSASCEGLTIRRRNRPRGKWRAVSA